MQNFSFVEKNVRFFKIMFIVHNYRNIDNYHFSTFSPKTKNKYQFSRRMLLLTCTKTYRNKYVLKCRGSMPQTTSVSKIQVIKLQIL